MIFLTGDPIVDFLLGFFTLFTIFASIFLWR